MRFLYLFIAIFAHVSCSMADDLAEEKAAILKLRGATTNLQKNRDGFVRLIRFSKPHVTDEHLEHIRAFKQIDYLAIVHPGITSRGIANVANLTRLDTLLLSESQADDKALSHLEKLENLERLYLESTRITDAGLSKLKGLRKLRILSLQGTGITDAGLAHLSDLKNLETIDLSDTHVSDQGLAHLAALPRLKHLILARTKTKGSRLAGFKELQLLDLTGCNIGDVELKSLQALKKLKQLQLCRTTVSAEGYEDAVVAMPKTTIRVDTSVRPIRRFDPRMLTKNVVSAKGKTIKPILPPAKQRFRDTKEVPDFQKHVLPLFGRLGCNSRACHGSFQGQGGFRLSMFGYDFNLDHDNLTKGDNPRVEIGNSIESLLLQKPTSEDDHEGGLRFKKGEWEYWLLKNWIDAGARNVKKDAATFRRLEVSPSEITFSQVGEEIQLKVISVWSDGSREDVTCLTRFQSNDDAIASVSADGLVKAIGKGDTYIISFYDNGISSTEVILPVSELVGDRYPSSDSSTKIDMLVQRKLSRLGIVPSAICSDEEFLRRISLDLIGTLPTPAEVESFVADPAADKRSRKIDELLESPAYVAWWTTRLCDLTGSNAGYLGGTEMASPVARQWRIWLQRRVEENVGWDKIVSGIVLGTNRLPDQTYEQFTRRYSKFTASKNPTDYAASDNAMPHYWYRDNQSLPKDKALTFGYTFLGVQLGCAECHKHPYDQWSQEDFVQFTEFFKPIRKGAAADVRIENALARERLGVPVKLNTAALRRQSYLRIAAEGRPIPWFETYIEPTKTNQTAKLLGGQQINLGELDDPREPLMAWLLQKGNPYFATSFVNRIWANYFHVGIINPPDDLNLANPPSNKPLLAYLANEFVRKGYDMKWLHREIANSRTYQRSWRPNETNRKDLKNFSHSVVRRLQAEVAIDAVLQSTVHSGKLELARTRVDTRKISQHPRSYQTRAIDYSLLVFGKPLRTTTCDCERRTQPTLLQALYIRNDVELIELLQRSDGWIYEVARREGLELRSETTGKVLLPARKNSPQKLDGDRIAVLVKTAYLRVLSRKPDTNELKTGKQHISRSPTTIEGLRDLLWALLNTQEFITNH